MSMAASTTETRNVDLARVIIILNEQPATGATMRALSLVDGVLPQRGTVGRREAFIEAHRLEASTS